MSTVKLTTMRAGRIQVSGACHHSAGACRLFQRAGKSLFLFLLTALPMLSACAAVGPVLHVRPAQSVENGKTRYDLILFGGRYGDDLSSMAILEIRSVPYRISPYAPKFDFRILKNLDARQATGTAVRFLKNINPNYTGITKNLILSPGGRPIGYEIRPQYLTIVYGIPDVLETDYQVWGKPVKGRTTVRAWIRVMPSVLIRRQGGGSSIKMR